MGLGFKTADKGFEPVFAVEIDEAAARTVKRNFDCRVHAGPIEDVETFPAVDVIIGGPPCQGFSPLGRDRDRVSRAVRRVRPRAFVIENVPEFQRSARFARPPGMMHTDPGLKEYAHGHGVPQLRRRGIFIAVHGIPRLFRPPPPRFVPSEEVPRSPIPSAGPSTGEGLRLLLAARHLAPHRALRPRLPLPLALRGPRRDVQGVEGDAVNDADLTGAAGDRSEPVAGGRRRSRTGRERR